MTPAEICQNIRQLVPMREAAEFYGFSVNRAGFISCPFHEEKTPSCKIYESSFNCFGCGENGDVIDFVRELYKIDFKAAVTRINCDFGLDLPLKREPSKEEQERARKLKAEREQKAEEKRVLSILTDRYSVRHRELWQQSKQRALSDEETCELACHATWLDAHPVR
ncbi:MAG: CHC2 zinc finger domain-containing protein [Ruminiclostridium sp.]